MVPTGIKRGQGRAARSAPVPPSPPGKMFKSLDLSLIVEFILMFYRDKPIDWLLDHILWVKVCNPEKDAVSRGCREAGWAVGHAPSSVDGVCGWGPHSGRGAAGPGGP